MTTVSLPDAGPARSSSTMRLDGRPQTRRGMLSDLWRHRGVLRVLARTDFQVRYKRASFGVMWAVAVPLLQAMVLAVVFSRVVRVSDGVNFTAFVLSGVLSWTYLSATLGTGSTAVVDGTALADKVWFPRAILPLVPAAAGLVGFAISLAVMFAVLPILGVGFGAHLVLLVPAIALLIAFTVSLALVLAALHVYFRDVRYLVQAVLLVWFYVTPVIYPARLLGRLQHLVDLNPMTGIVALFRTATVGAPMASTRAIVVSIAVTAVLSVVSLEVYRRCDRTLIDRL